MSLDVDGFTNEIEGSEVIIKVDSNHKLLQLARNLPWEAILTIILPDLQRTERQCWWMGRPLRVRIQLGRIGGNFLFVGRCSSLRMPDAQSLPLMVDTHQALLGKGVLSSIATDKGYCSSDNEVAHSTRCYRDSPPTT